MKRLSFYFKNPENGERLLVASGILGEDIIQADGNYYVSPSALKFDKNFLEVEEKAYVCPYKGVCDYYNFVNDNKVVKKMLTWVYNEPKEGWEQIKGKFGFPGHSGMNDIEIDEEVD
ncbi:MAG: hypothetical protein KatS3mg085_791 [Candidatus Dojkabacteria bacterium]|nr:MAG: hypothetical protein KatS3mg085_791 [Candidatus Dojkabacteria bacterium]GIW58818.1 MAG: hypothetical protein KatS3mg086_103 [Candidatus Dojkabacteria bacterium]